MWQILVSAFFMGWVLGAGIYSAFRLANADKTNE